MLAYLVGPRAGAFAYDLVHTYALALPLAVAGFAVGSTVASALALIWIAHIGFDRMLGYGFKYRSGFGDTHLGRIGRLVRRRKCAFTPSRLAAFGSRRARSSAEAMGLGSPRAALRREWSDWLPVKAYAIEHRDGVSNT